MKYLCKILVVVCMPLLLSSCGSKTVELESSAVLEKYKSISTLNQLLAKAEKAGAADLAPNGFEQAKDSYLEAFEKASTQKSNANELAESGIKGLRNAMKNTEISKVLFRDVLDARSKTMEADAQSIFPDKFLKIESRLRDAAMDVEKGNIDDAKEQRASLIKEYSTLELAALKTNTTQKAKAKIVEAERNKADKYAPKTFRLAEEELALALDVLTAGRTQTGKAQEHALLSVYYSEKSMQISELVVEFDRRDFTEEDMLLWYQEQLELINKPFNKALPFDRSNYDVVTDLQGRIIGLQAAIVQKDRDLLSSSENIAMLEGRIDSIGAQSKKVSAESRKAEARYKRIQNMFTEDEAYVFRQGNNVLLETHAFNFQIGGSEINSSNFGLLEKIMDAIKVFNNPDIMIMGHTDSTGGDAINLQLSEKRAQTVTSFLQKIGKFASNKISYKGFGEARPVASNETKQGRERNRRIEVLIINK